MKIVGNIPQSRVQYLPVDGNGSDIVDGAVLSWGLTAEQDMGVLKLAPDNGADAYGLIAELHDFSLTGDSTPESASNYVKRRVIPFTPGQWVEAKYDLTDTITATGGSTTTVTATSLEDNLDGSWIYFVSGTAIGQLAYVTASAAGTATFEAIDTAPVNGDTFIKIMRPGGDKLLKMNAAKDKLGSDAAAGTWTARVIFSIVKWDTSSDWEMLDPGIHHNKQLNDLNAQFKSIIVPNNIYCAPID